jgi:hypothetical protein
MSVVVEFSCPRTVPRLRWRLHEGLFCVESAADDGGVVWAAVSRENWSHYPRHLLDTISNRHCFILVGRSPLFGQSYRHELNFAS